MKDFAARLAAIVIIAALTLAGVVPSFASGGNTESEPDITGTSAILIDGGTGEILYEKNAHEKRDPASITKILNCLVVLENMDLDQEVTVPYQIDQIGHVMGLKEGEVLTVRQLLYAMMTYSCNDAAEMLAVATGGSIDEFCKMMNERAVKCGAKDTNFTNPNGLNGWGQENHRTTAYDIAMIAREAMKNSMFRKLVSTRSYTIPATNKSEERKLVNTNPCIYPEGKTVDVNGKQVSFSYKGMTGIKTGSTGTAGECFCGSAKRGGTELIGVSLNSKDEFVRFTDVTTLLDYGFSKYFTYKALDSDEPSGSVKVSQGEKRSVDIGLKDDFDITLKKGYDTDGISVSIEKDSRKIKAPVSKGTKLGKAVATDKNGKVLASADLYALESSGKGGPLSHIGIADEDLIYFFTVITLILIALVAVILINRRKRAARARARARQRERQRREAEEKLRKLM